jgi:predicted phage replisome organizer
MNISWIKMSVSMFDDDKIKIIETLPNGYEYIVIWVKILCMAGKKNDNGCIYLVKELPLDEAMLARVAGHNVDVFKAAIAIFESFGMITFFDGHMQLTNWAKYQDKLKSYDDVLTQNAIRQQKSRNKRKIEAEKLGIGNQRVIPSRYESRDVTPLRREVEGETEKKIEREPKNSDENFLEEGSNFQQPHPIFLPTNLEIDGIEKDNELPKENSTSKSSGGVLNLKTSNVQSPKPPDIAKIGRDMFELLRKKFPKDEMDNFLNSIDIDLPTISNMFAEYWLFEKGRTFNKGETTGVFNSFRSWIKIAKSKEIPEKEVKQGLHTNPILEKIIPNIERLKMIKLNPTDANKVNAFIRECSPSEWALRDGTKSFFDGGSKEWDHWIKAIKGAIQREKMGDI